MQPLYDENLPGLYRNLNDASGQIYSSRAGELMNDSSNDNACEGSVGSFRLQAGVAGEVIE